MPGNALIQSLVRGLDLVRLLAGSDNGMTMAEVISATGLKRPTVHNLLRTLASRDFVRKEGNRFRVGSALHEMVARDACSQLLELAEERTCLLAEALPEATVSYCEPVGTEVVVRFRKFPERILMERNSGALMAPYQTASGLAYLAYADPDTRQAIALRYPFEATAHTVWRSEASLEEFLKCIRKNGFVGLGIDGDTRFMRVAVPGMTPSGRFVGVFGASWQNNEENPEKELTKVVEVLREAASELVASLNEC